MHLKIIETNSITSGTPKIITIGSEHQREIQKEEMRERKESSSQVG